MIKNYNELNDEEKIFVHGALSRLLNDIDTCDLTKEDIDNIKNDIDTEKNIINDELKKIHNLSAPVNSTYALGIGCSISSAIAGIALHTQANVEALDAILGAAGVSILCLALNGGYIKLVKGEIEKKQKYVDSLEDAIIKQEQIVKTYDYCDKIRKRISF